ncbi:MAG: helix-turn-helix domain-containing protein [Frisingicoccus sp.]
MESAKMIRELRESINMSRREFSLHTGIPVRTLEDWEAGRRTPPEYVPRLIAYQLKYEELVQRMDIGADEKIEREDLNDRS